MPSAPTILLAGKPKIGKSTAIIRALGDAAFYVGTEPGFIKPAFAPYANPTIGTAKPWFPQPGRDYVECLAEKDPIGEVEAMLNARMDDIRRRGAVVVDTLSSLVDRDMWWLKNGGVPAKQMKAYGEPYQSLYDRIKHMIYIVLREGVIVCATAHEQDPSNFEGKFRPGGVKLPGQLVKDMPSLFDTILRCGVEMTPTGPARVFRCDPLDIQYVTGDRWNVVVGTEPMDLELILRRILLVSKGRWEEAEKLRPASAVAAATPGSGF